MTWKLVPDFLDVLDEELWIAVGNVDADKRHLWNILDDSIENFIICITDSWWDSNEGKNLGIFFCKSFPIFNCVVLVDAGETLLLKSNKDKMSPVSSIILKKTASIGLKYKLRLGI